MTARKIATGDCETTPFKHGRFPKPFLWCIFDGDEHFMFDTASEMVEFLHDKKWIVYFHNGGKFDYFFMLEHLEEFSPIMNINGRLAKFKIGECEFRDSYNLLPVPLAAYQKTEIDYSIFEDGERDKPDNWRKIVSYLKDDCTFLYDLVSKFIEDYGVNLTLASAAFKTFNKEFSIKENLKTNADFYAEYKRFYYGGRVECFQKGVIDFEMQCLDINSAYPFAMLQTHPYGNTISEHTDINEIDPADLGRCFIDLDCVAHGCFPHRNEDKSLSFPNDNERRRYHVTGWEYLAALRTNKIKDVSIYKVIKFLERIEFAPYVHHFYSKKNESEKGTPDYIIAKLFLNALYGKYAANPEKYKETFICPPQYIADTCERLDLDFAGECGPWALLERDLPEEKQNYYNVATAASITGFVRAYLFEAMEACENVVYCDTDSIFCETHHLQLGDELGQWDIEGEFTGGGIGGKKLYAFKYKDKEKYKYASKGARLTPEQILQVCAGDNILYKSDAPTFSLKKDAFFRERNIKLT